MQEDAIHKRGAWLMGALALAGAGCVQRAEPPAGSAATAAVDLNGTWSGPTPEFTSEDSIPLPAIGRNVGWAPFSAGLPENRKALPREQQLKQREAFLAYFRKLVASGANVFSKTGPIRGRPGIQLPLTEAGRQALEAARGNAIANRIPDHDENSLLKCYPENYAGPGDPVTIVQGPKAIVFYAGTHTRIVYLDGRGFDSAPLPDYGGYSIGHWAGGTLVVETRWFRGPTLQQSLAGPVFPLSEQAQLTEYISKIEGDQTLQIKTVLEDPLFLTEKLGKMEYLSWAPGDVPVNENCIEGLIEQIPYDASKFKP